MVQEKFKSNGLCILMETKIATLICSTLILWRHKQEAIILSKQIGNQLNQNHCKILHLQ